jgi:nucleotide-binding universal stress UspA family protein
VSAASTGEQTAGRIVVGVDGSPSSEHALRWAAGQARLTGQEVHAVITWELPVPYDVPVPVDLNWRADASAALTKSIENALGEPGSPPVVQHVIEGRPAKVLIDAARDADLLVVGSRGHGGFTGLLLGSVSEHVLAHATCPVVVVHEHRATTGRIVVGIDGSPESSQALRWAAREAELSGCELHAVLAWHIPFTYGVLDMNEPDWAAHASQVLATAVAGALEGTAAARVVQEVVEDYPAAALLHAAEEADLLVVGSRGRGTFAGLLLGSVSRHVAAHASCPVVVHHAPESQPHPEPRPGRA